MPTDVILRILAKEAGIRAMAAVTTDLVDEGARRHKTAPLSTAVLGHGLTAAALLGALLKVEQRVALRVEGNGPAGRILAESDAYGRVRGYVENTELAGPLPITRERVAEAIGNEGTLLVVRDLRLKSLVESVTPLHSGFLDENLTLYLLESDQIPSAVRMGVQMSESGELVAAGGLLAQVMPDYDRAAWEQVHARLTALDPGHELAEGRSPDDILAHIFEGIPYEVLERRQVRFSCTCNREQIERVLLGLDVKDLRDLIDDGGAEVTCQYCGEVYHFDVEDLLALIERKKMN
jgi:molecular chaperone Hsp33